MTMKTVAASLQSILQSNNNNNKNHHQQQYKTLLSEWNDRVEGIILSSNGRLDITNTNTKDDDFETNEIPIQTVALEFHTIVQTFLKKNFPSKSNEDTVADTDTVPVVVVQQSHQEEQLLELLSEYLRTIKNLIRYNRLFLTSLKYLGKSSQRHHDTLVTLAGISHMECFCAVPMIRLYLDLVTTGGCGCGSVSNGSSSSCPSSEEKMEVDLMNKLGAQQQQQQEVARNAAACLFHSTFGYATEPICKKALYALVSSSSSNTNGLNGIPTLAKLLVSGSSFMSVPVLLGILKNIHNLVGSFPGIRNEFDAAFQALDDTNVVGPLILPNTSTNEEEQEQLPLTLVTILITTLAWSIRSTTTPNPFSGTCTPRSVDDRQCDVAKEIISILFALNIGPCSKQITSSPEHRNIMTQLGVLIVDVLHLPNGDGRVYDLKLQILILLLGVTDDSSSSSSTTTTSTTSSLNYTEYLLINNAMDPLLDILELQLIELCVVRVGQLQSEEHSVPILPILIVLNKLSIANPVILHKVKSKLFPPEREELFIQAVEQQQNQKANEKAKGVEQAVKNQTKGSGSFSSGGRNMHPLDAPKGTLRHHLISLMTWTESNVKRCSSELLWTLCNKDSNEFVARTGFGNAVHMMGIKGLVSIPNS